MSEPRDTGWARLSSVRIGAVVAVALAAAFVIWLVVRGNDDDSSASTTTSTTTSTTAGPKPIGPVAASPAALRAVAASSKHPVYWVGPRPGQTYELTRTGGNRVFVRYLPAGVKVGAPRPAFTIVGTYPTQNAIKVLKDLSKQAGERTVAAPGGGFGVYDTSAPTNIYVAFPGSDVQIEVFDPSAQKARRLVTTGRVVPVG